MEMQNLKVTFHFDNCPAIINRFTTIDSIVLSAYYAFKASKGERLEYDPDHKTVDFIHRQDGVFSGSIWYIDKKDNVYHDFNTIVKKKNDREIFDATTKRTEKNALYKGAIIGEETILLPKIHFFVRGKKKHIEALLLHGVKGIGKKQKLGFGTISHIDVEEIEEDKGYMLNNTTPSKPLPVDDFNVNTKKVAFFRRSAPYWEKEGKEACYMPTTSLYETVDETAKKGGYKVAKDLSYIPNTHFIYDVCSGFSKKNPLKEVTFESLEVIKKIPKKKAVNYAAGELSEPRKCVFTGAYGTKGVYGDTRAFFFKTRKKFADYDCMEQGDFISREVLWCLNHMDELGYALVTKGDKTWSYLQGQKKKDGTTLNDYIVDHKKFKPPFSINLKESKNAQHVSFRGEVSISNAFYFVQLGKTRLQIDVELLNKAILDIRKITKKYKSITKTHLCGIFGGDKKHIELKRDSTEEERQIIIEFQKKYNSDLRHYMSMVSFE